MIWVNTQLCLTGGYPLFSCEQASQTIFFFLPILNWCACALCPLAAHWNADLNRQGLKRWFKNSLFNTGVLRNGSAQLWCHRISRRCWFSGFHVRLHSSLAQCSSIGYLENRLKMSPHPLVCRYHLIPKLMFCTIQCCPCHWKALLQLTGEWTQ